MGKRVKELLQELAYQRLRKGEELHPKMARYYPTTGVLPASVDVIYNNIHGSQKDVEG